MSFISYIVPVYNVSRLELSRCIDSIVHQTYSDNEILIVEDGSTNGVELFCDELSQKYDIKVIHQTNQGLAAARNTGLEVVKGDWIVHVDGDDWVDSHLSESLVKQCSATNTDIIVWGFIVSTGKKKQELLLKNKRAFDKNYESIKEDVLCSVLGGSDTFSSLCLNTSWAKAYRRDFVMQHHLFFDPRLRRAQDVVYNLRAFDMAESIAYIDKALSIYRNDNESLSRGFNLDNINHIQATANVVKEFIENRSPSPELKRAYYLFIQRCFRMINEQTIQNRKNKQTFKEKKRVFNTLMNQEPFLSAFRSGEKRSGIWRILDVLYGHQLFISIYFFNSVVSFLYKLKHFA